jgi:hypothetical protein
VSASVSDPAWNSESSRSVFTSSGGGSMIRSLGSWIFAPSRVWHTAKPPVSADVVIQMSMPNLLMSGVQSSSSR